jgi:hypothetical protein
LLQNTTKVKKLFITNLHEYNDLLNKSSKVICVL